MTFVTNHMPLFLTEHPNKCFFRSTFSINVVLTQRCCRGILTYHRCCPLCPLLRSHVETVSYVWRTTQIVLNTKEVTRAQRACCLVSFPKLHYNENPNCFRSGPTRTLKRDLLAHESGPLAGRNTCNCSVDLKRTMVSFGKRTGSVCQKITLKRFPLVKYAVSKACWWDFPTCESSSGRENEWMLPDSYVICSVSRGRSWSRGQSEVVYCFIKQLVNVVILHFKWWCTTPVVEVGTTIWTNQLL